MNIIFKFNLKNNKINQNINNALSRFVITNKTIIIINYCLLKSKTKSFSKKVFQLIFLNELNKSFANN